MPRPKLWLHAGVHKTGTTAIQQFAAAHRSTLWERGLWYPDFQPVRPDNPVSHNPLAHSLARPKGTRGFSSEQIRALVDHWLDNADERPILISAEAFCRHLDVHGGEGWREQREAYVERLGEVFADFDIEVILALRRQDHLAHSLYIENIMKGSRRGRMSFPQFRDFIQQRHLRFEENVAAFERVFGPVRVLTYEGLAQNGRLCQAFFAELGLHVEDLADPGLIRRSLSMRQARMKRALVPVIASRGQNQKINRFLKWPLMERILGWVLEESGTGFWESEALRQRWLEGYSAENERLRARFFPERLSLFLPVSE